VRSAALVAAAAAGVLLATAGAAAAHPLGNFTVNRSSELVVSGGHVYVRVALDLAEIPTFEQGDRIRGDRFPRELARRLELRVDGRRVPLRPLDSAVSTQPGAGGLETMRFEVVYDGGLAGRTLSYRDASFGSRLGWKEVVVRAERGARVVRSSAPSTSSSDRLRRYPNGERLDVASATAAVVPSAAAGVAPAVDRPRREESLVASELTPGFVLAALALALFWGAAHALGPGHGKAIVAGYLVGARGTARHAVLLGAIVTVTHTLGVFALGLVALALSSVLLPEQLYPWLTLVSGLLVVAVGAGILRSRLAHARAHAKHDHHHHHDHDHDHGDLSARNLLGVGISGGIVPCPTALVVLLAAIGAQRVGFGLLLIVAFSLGLAASITGIGLLAVGAKQLFARVRFDGTVVRALPAASAFLVLALGVVMTVRALGPLT
jgi:nickel/cobalt exporter